MELIKKNIHIDRMKCKAATQITLEDDINITDSRPDVYQLIEEQGEIVIDELRAVADHVYVKGKLEFRVLYLSDEDVRRPASMEGSLPFDEQIYMEGVVPTDGVCIRKELEDLNVGMINSRKLSVQALAALNSMWKNCMKKRRRWNCTAMNRWNSAKKRSTWQGWPFRKKIFSGFGKK